MKINLKKTSTLNNKSIYFLTAVHSNIQEKYSKVGGSAFSTNRNSVKIMCELELIKRKFIIS